MSDINARYLGLTANQLAKIATNLERENAKLRKENDTLCRRIDELCMENEQLRNQHTAKARRIVVSESGVGHAECGVCGGAIDQDDAFCRHCGRRLEDA